MNRIVIKNKQNKDIVVYCNNEGLKQFEKAIQEEIKNWKIKLESNE